MEQLQHKGACPHCGQVHDDDLDKLADLAEVLASSFTDEAFPELWKEAKDDLKEMKRKEVAEEMFYTGAVQMLTAFMSTMHDLPEEIKKRK